MSFPNSEIFYKAEDSSGKKILKVVNRPDGVGWFGELTQEYDEYLGDYYWEPSYESGLYASAEDALAEARKILGWLNEVE
jgi:hypothetical protein